MMACCGRSRWVADVVYFPLETELLRTARSIGCRTMAGGTLTVFQAVGAFRLFIIIELHISNIHRRDKQHRHSKISASVHSVICGLGPYGYIVAMQASAQLLDALPADMPTSMRRGPQ